MNVPLPTKSLPTTYVPIETPLGMTLGIDCGFKARQPSKGSPAGLLVAVDDPGTTLGSETAIAFRSETIRQGVFARPKMAILRARTQNPCTASAPIFEYADKYLLVKPRTPSQTEDTLHYLRGLSERSFTVSADVLAPS